MKIRIHTLAFLLTVLLFNSCSEDFELTEPYKDIPVVYALIDRTDSAQYFRIEKAFVDENIPASQIAKIPDSLYYPNAVVRLLNKSKNDTVGFTLVKVDGNNEGYPRNPGPFATSPNWLYKLNPKDNALLVPGDNYTLHLKRSENSQPVTSTITLVSDIAFTNPDNNKRQLKIFYESQIGFQWRNASNTSAFDLKAIVYIDELNIITQELKTKKIEIPLGINIFGVIGKPTNNLTNFTFFGSSFYNFFHDQLVPETGVERYITKIDFVLRGGGPEFGEYYKILNANTGITASQEIPRYSNLSEGYGIFSSTVSITKSMTPEAPTVDSLRAHPLTRDLNFK
jgi:hypothetical protein